MKMISKESINRDTQAGKTYRLICISNPGQKACRQRKGRAATAAVQIDEHTSGMQGCLPDLPAHHRQTKQAQMFTGNPGSDQLQAPGTSRATKPAPVVPEVPENSRSQVTAAFQLKIPDEHQPEMTADAKSPHPGAQDVPVEAGPVISVNRSAEQAAPDTAGGGAV